MRLAPGVGADTDLIKSECDHNLVPDLTFQPFVSGLRQTRRTSPWVAVSSSPPTT